MGYLLFPQLGHHLVLSFHKRAVFFAIGDLQDEGAPTLVPEAEILVTIAWQRFRRDHQTVFILSNLAGLLAGQVRGLGNNRGHEGACKMENGWGLHFWIAANLGWKKAVSKELHANSRKSILLRICLSLHGRGQIPRRSITRRMTLPVAPAFGPYGFSFSPQAEPAISK